MNSMKGMSFWILLIDIDCVYVYIPGTQITLVLIGKDLLLEAKQGSFGFQVYYAHIHTT